MGSFIIGLISITVLSVAAVLILGIISMAKGGDFNKKYGNKLMRARVLLQAVSLILIASLWFLSTQ